MLQKVLQVGNSAAVTIPAPFLSDLGLMVGDRVEVRATKRPVKIEIIPSKKILRKASGITPEFADSVEEFIKEYRPVLEELARR
ncbi:MAG: Uncharacterized protein G01um10147_155 [Microgenomates group bacterium Gr01-1014_7]|nr:MAG: Uncharacterized protein G01um10147_155 [Microgenomates group bacterium Gr01-1014_7]